MNSTAKNFGVRSRWYINRLRAAAVCSVLTAGHRKLELEVGSKGWFIPVSGFFPPGYKWTNPT